MELNEVHLLEYLLPNELYNVVKSSDVAQQYYYALYQIGCTVDDYNIAENQYKSLLVSILVNNELLSKYIN